MLVPWGWIDTVCRPPFVTRPKAAVKAGLAAVTWMVEPSALPANVPDTFNVASLHEPLVAEQGWFWLYASNYLMALRGSLVEGSLSVTWSLAVPPARERSDSRSGSGSASPPR